MLLVKKTKQELRKNALKKRKDIAGKLNVISDIIVFKIINSPFFKNAENIALFYPVKNEINLLKLLEIKNKNFYFPKCINEYDLEFVKYNNNKEKFIIDKFNIPIATGEIIEPKKLDVILTPALIANSKNYRLGYGRGYYDKFFKTNNIKAKKIIVIAKDFIDDEFIEDDFDVQCDLIISA